MNIQQVTVKTVYDSANISEFLRKSNLFIYFVDN